MASKRTPPISPEQVLALPEVIESIARGFLQVEGTRIWYHLNQRRDYSWKDPEEWIRARAISFLIAKRGYPANRIKTEVTVPRRTPADHADVVVYADDKCHTPYLVVEAKASGQNRAKHLQAVEQLFGNTNSLRAPLGLLDEGEESTFYDIGKFPTNERTLNIKGTRDAIPSQYGNAPIYTYVAAGATDIQPVPMFALESKIRRSHSIIWAGGKRDPLLAFDEWSKLLFAKVVDERNTPTNQPRSFQIGTNETVTAVATRVHKLFSVGCQNDPSVFPLSTRINLPDKKISDVVHVLQGVSLVGTDIDTIGGAFENFFGSIFRGELGQYFTMRPLARFVVSLLDISHEDFVIDPTAGSGGFLLEALLQVWHEVDAKFHGQRQEQINRAQSDFALIHVYGIEIHEILSRICKINLLLHHDGHTNIEGDKSCLDIAFSKSRLRDWRGKFTKAVGNPPFGDEVLEGDEDLLGENRLENFAVARGRDSIPSEHAIVERVVDLLEPDGRFGLILPDGFLNNQGILSNCPRMRSYLAKHGQLEAIASLPDFAFRKSGAQNKTSIVFFRKFTVAEKLKFDSAYQDAYDEAIAASEKTATDDERESAEAGAILAAYSTAPFNRMRVFFAEANHIGYGTTGVPSAKNDLYRGSAGGKLDVSQDGTILGEWRKFRQNPVAYRGSDAPDCLSLTFAEAWAAHPSRRLDPKYHLFKRKENAYIPNGWIRVRVRRIMRRRLSDFYPELTPDVRFRVMTIGQSGEIRPREAGKGRNPPDWLGMYFETGSSTWFAARSGDVVYSSIDLWKGCIAVVPADFDGALVTKEFPIYEVTDERIGAEFLSYLLRTRYYQRAFRAITTGHSNRRRTQMQDFEDIEICFPPTREEQERICERIRNARRAQRSASELIRAEFSMFSDLVDGRHLEDLPEIDENLETDE